MKMCMDHKLAFVCRNGLIRISHSTTVHELKLNAGHYCKYGLRANDLDVIRDILTGSPSTNLQWYEDPVEDAFMKSVRWILQEVNCPFEEYHQTHKIYIFNVGQYDLSLAVLVWKLRRNKLLKTYIRKRLEEFWKPHGVLAIKGWSDMQKVVN